MLNAESVECAHSFSPFLTLSPRYFYKCRSLCLFTSC